MPFSLLEQVIQYTWRLLFDQSSVTFPLTSIQMYPKMVHECTPEVASRVIFEN